MEKNIPVPNTRIFNGKKTIGNQSTQSVILNVSRLLLHTINGEEHYLKTEVCNISHVDADDLITCSSHGIIGLAPCLRTGCLT